jgi:hypothetical protein
MRQCQCKDNVCSLIFLHGVFHGKICDILYYRFLLFFHRVLEIFAQIFIIYIFRFFSLDFLKIVFILCNI